MLGLEPVVLGKAPSESRKFQMVVEAAAQAVRDERAKASTGGKVGAGATERRNKVHHQPANCEMSAEEENEVSGQSGEELGMDVAEAGDDEGSDSNDGHELRVDPPPSRAEAMFQARFQG